MQALLLPGMDGTGALFEPLLQELSPELRPRVVAYPTDVPLGYDALLETISIPEGRFAILAESFSGPLGIRLAARHPGQVSALVLVSSFVRCPSPLLRWLRPLLGSLTQVVPPDWALRASMLSADASPTAVDALRSALARVTPAVLATRLRAVAEVDVTRTWQTLALPVMLLAGTRDRLVGRSATRELEDSRPGTRIEWLEAPHLILQLAPREAARCLERLLLEASISNPD